MQNQSYGTRRLGSGGEATVATWLQHQGFTIIERNYTTRTGEVDIIAERGEVLAFVEVKTRRNSNFDMGVIVTPGKQRRIIRATHHYILVNQIEDRVCRFDVALVIGGEPEPEIEYIEDAFQEGW